jgi:hypothetical protein
LPTEVDGVHEDDVVDEDDEDGEDCDTQVLGFGTH